MPYTPDPAFLVFLCGSYVGFSVLFAAVVVSEIVLIFVRRDRGIYKLKLGGLLVLGIVLAAPLFWLIQALYYSYESGEGVATAVVWGLLIAAVVVTFLKQKVFTT